MNNYMEKLNGLLNDNYKYKDWKNRNYFYVGTIAVVIINIILYGFFGNNWDDELGLEIGKPKSGINIDKIVASFLNSFSHANWQHVLLNMLCFFVCGLYLERKIGSLRLLGLVFVLAFFTSLAETTHGLSTGWHGFSCTNFGLYSYIMINYMFSFKKTQRTRADLISGGVVVALIYLAMCFNGGTKSFGFEWYPYDLINNSGHYTGAITGLILGLFTRGR